jgi:DNA repair exonuclease SbcCD ATPase subunit
MEDIPKVLETFILAVFRHSQSSQHLKNAEGDYDNMLSRYRDYPALGTQRTAKREQAQKDFKITEAQTAEATASLLDAFKGHLTSGPASHQDCVSRSEFDKFKDQIRATRVDAHELERLHEKNHDIKKRLEKVEDNLDSETRSARKLEDHLMDLENITRATTKAAESACDNYKSLQESTNKDRLSFRTRCSALETEMDKSKTKHKALDEYVHSSTAKHETQARSFDICRQEVESLQKLGTEVDSKLKDHSETLLAIRKDLHGLKNQAIRPPVSPVSRPPTVPDTSPDPVLEGIECRLKAVEKSVAGLREDANGEDTMVNGMLDELQSHLDQVEVRMNKLQSINEEGNLERRDLSERIAHLALSKDTLTANVARTEKLNLRIENELQTAIDEVKQGALQGVPEDLKVQLEYISRTVETHIELHQRHENRFNSVTTDELYRQMEHQFRQSYGVPGELRGLVQRQSKAEAIYKNFHEAVSNKVSELHTRCEAVTTELRGSKFIDF